MKKRDIIILLLITGCLLSCETRFDLGEPTNAKLCLVCYPGLRDTTIIQLYKTVPIGGKYEGSPYLKEADINYFVNGDLRSVQHADTRVGTVPRGCWFVPEATKAGDYIAVTASSREVEDIMASTTIPALPPDFSYECEYDEGVVLNLSFEDDNLSRDSYGIAMVCERTLTTEGERTVETKYLDLFAEGYGTQQVAVIRDYYDAEFTGWSLCPQNTAIYGVRIWPDTKQSGNKAKLSARFGPGYFETEIAGATEQRRYKVRLYRFTPEFMNYLSALDYNENNKYASYGLIPMMPSFTNVSGGCGILAGWSVRETSWFTIH